MLARKQSRSCEGSDCARRLRGLPPGASVRHPGRDAFVDEPAFAKALHAEGGGQRRGAGRHEFGKGPARSGRGLEPAGAPAAVDEAVRCMEILAKDGVLKAQNRLHSFKP